jgi:hypothetical protein
MNIYDFIQMINDPYNVVFKVFDCNTENCVFVSDDEDETGIEFTADMLLDSKYADLEFYSIDMWMDKGKMYLELNVDIEEDDFE